MLPTDPPRPGDVVAYTPRPGQDPEELPRAWVRRIDRRVLVVHVEPPLEGIPPWVTVYDRNSGMETWSAPAGRFRIVARAAYVQPDEAGSLAAALLSECSEVLGECPCPANRAAMVLTGNGLEHTDNERKS